MNSMKQVYKTENLEEPPSQNAYVRGGVLFVGFLVWLMAVTDSFGQAATRIINSTTPSSGSCSVKARVKLEHLKQEARATSGNNGNGNGNSNANGSWKELVAYKVFFSFKNKNGVVGEIREATTASDGSNKGIATTDIIVPFGAEKLLVEFKGDANYAPSVLEIPFTVTAAATRVLMHPTGQMVCEGSTASFTANAEGTPAPSVKWQVKAAGSSIWADITGNASATTATLVVSTVTPSMEGYQYRAVYGNACGSPVATDGASLKVYKKPEITVPSIPVQYSQADKCAASVYFSAGVASSTTPVVSYSIVHNGVATAITSPYEFPVGTTAVTVQATNNCGTDTKAFDVVVEDNVAPVVAARSFVALSLDAAGKAYLSVSDVLLEPSKDNCGIMSEALDLSEFTCAHVGADNRVKLIVTDIHNNVTVKEIAISVSNAAPEILSLMPATAGAAAINSAVEITAKVNDINAKSAGVNWGDGSSAEEFAVNSGGFAASHTYTAPGLYSVTVTVTDVCGQATTRVYEYIAIYDPQAGFITGGGWINSAPGSLVEDASATGKASYGFVTKYSKETGLPTGDVDFEFAAGNLSLESTKIDWLVIAGNNAWIKGLGTINGASNCSFLLSAVDSDLNGYRNQDAFRMQIWNGENGALVYDSQAAAAGNAPAAQVIDGGSIVVHKPAAARTEAGSGQASSFDLKAYPNPSALGIFRVSAAKELDDDAMIMVLDMQGQTVYSSVLEAGSLTLEVDLSGKQPGIYMVQVRNGSNRETLRLIKP